MAVLSEQNRAECRASLMRGLLPNEARNSETWAAPKADLRSLINAADDFADANAAAYNTTNPVGIRSKFTTKQKALALAYVCLRRAGVL